jgi:hypothetical protein
MGTMVIYGSCIDLSRATFYLDGLDQYCTSHGFRLAVQIRPWAPVKIEGAIHTECPFLIEKGVSAIQTFANYSERL